MLHCETVQFFLNQSHIHAFFFALKFWQIKLPFPGLLLRSFSQLPPFRQKVDEAGIFRNQPRNLVNSREYFFKLFIA